MSDDKEKLETVREPNGRWVEGAPSPNPKGRGAGRETWQSHADRLDGLLEKYTFAVIKQIIADPTQLDKLPLKDALILRNITNALQGDGLERERLYSRLFGEPIKRSELTGADGKDLFDADATRAKIRSKLFPPDEQGTP